MTSATRLARGISAVAAIACLLAVLAGCGAHRHPRPRVPRSPAPPVVPFPNTANGIHLGLAFDYSAHDPSAVASNVDYIFGGYFLDWNFGVHPPVKHTDSYLPFDTDAYPQSAKGHSLADWRASHPDWIVYQCDEKTPAYYPGDTNVPLDYTNPAVRAFEKQEVAATFALGAQGIAFDDFTFSNAEARCGVYRNGIWTSLGYPGRWQDNDKFNADLMTWLRSMRADLKAAFPTKSLALNMNLFASGIDHSLQIVPYVDMVFDEGGFTNYGTNKLTGSLWQDEVRYLEDLNSQGKAFFVNGIVNAPDDATVSPDQINWVLANYLLVKGAHSYTYVYAGNHGGATGSPSGYGTFYDRPQYHIPIGYPTSDRYQFAGAELRSYSGGLVLVNPSSSRTVIVPLGQTYRDMFGASVSNSATLMPATGLVLLNP